MIVQFQLFQPHMEFYLQTRDDKFSQGKETTEIDGKAFINKRECWICYDNDKPDPLIQPCACTGDVSSVHHDCLRRWLVESSACNQVNISIRIRHVFEILSSSSEHKNVGIFPLND